MNKFQNIMKIYEKMTNENILNNNNNKIILNNPKTLFDLNISGIKYEDELNSSNISKEENPFIKNIDLNPNLKMEMKK